MYFGINTYVEEAEEEFYEEFVDYEGSYVDYQPIGPDDELYDQFIGYKTAI